MSGVLKVRNWERFQGYKRRGPPWIKLHARLLEDYEFYQLTDRQGLILILIWLLASRVDNQLPDDADWLSHALHMGVDNADLEALVSGKWLVRSNNDTSVATSATKLARVQRRNASPETETETETEQRQSSDASHPAAPPICSPGSDHGGIPGALWTAIRSSLWAPDGRCPATIAGEAWTEQREGSVLKALLKHYSVSQLEIALLGLGLLRQGYGERPEWLVLGEKCSARALNHTHAGALDMVALATRTYWEVQNKRPKKSAVPSLGTVLGLSA